jgi:hypothetical protein
LLLKQLPAAYDIGHVSITGELVRMQMVKRHVKEADVVKKDLP